jgi:hypothetical protein
LYFLRQIGFDPIRTLRGLSGLPKYLKDLSSYSFKSGLKNLRISPALLDFSDQSGVADGHYFWQDLIVAQWIFKANPTSHLDIGSRLDGFVAHLLTFREVEISDIRPLAHSIPNLTVNVGNAISALNVNNKQYDSVSCLHSIEHFGLGRYGDPIDVHGHVKGLINIAGKVKPGGILYLSFPIGYPITEFNSQRIIHPNWPVEVLNNFALLEFVVIPWTGSPLYGQSIENLDLKVVGRAAIYRFQRR